MGSLHWLPSRAFKSDCDTEWSQSSIDRSWMLFHGMDFSCYWQEVWEFNLFRWFEKAWSWCNAFYVWEWWQIWLCDQRSWHKEASWIWYNNLLCFECQTVVEGWLWFVSVSKWCCFDLWWCLWSIFGLLRSILILVCVYFLPVYLIRCLVKLQVENGETVWH